MNHFVKKALCTIGLSSLLIAACGPKQALSEPVSGSASEGDPAKGNIPDVPMEKDSLNNESNAEEEINISSGIPTDGAVTIDQHRVIGNQSFDVDLQGWGPVRFVSCEPDDVLDVPRFYLEKDGKTVYTFSWEDRTGTPGVFDSVRFVSFPDIDGDGRKDVVIGVGKVFENKDSHIPYNVFSVYFNLEGGFEPADSITDQVNEAFAYSDAEYADVMELVGKCVADSSIPAQSQSTGQMEKDRGSKQAVPGDILVQAAGSWQLAGEKTISHLKQYDSLQDMFGTGIHQGAGLEISESGEMSYYIGIGVGGTGQCEVLDGSISVSVTPYQDLGDYDNDLTLHLVTEDNQEYLVMSYVSEEEIYWARK